MSVSEPYLIDSIVRHVLRRHPRARRKTVDEFLSESVGRNYRDRMEDLIIDSRIYRWNGDTIRAVKSGLFMLLENGLVER
jgi:hypothetical protein